jgi:hypothetical protein
MSSICRLTRLHSADEETCLGGAGQSRHRTEPRLTAAAELQGLLDDLRGQADAQATTEARQLREQIALARKAVRETQGG